MTVTMNDVDARALISKGGVARLGCVADGEPYVVPISYFYEDGFAYSHSLPGRKIDALRAHPRACLQVDEVKDEYHWHSAIAFGDFEELTQSSQRGEALKKLLERFPTLTPVESRLTQNVAPPEVIVFRIRIDRITGAAET